MSEFPGYAIKETLHTGSRSLVQRAVRLADEKPVVLKILNEATVTADMLARYKREFEIGASLNSGKPGSETVSGVIAMYGFESTKAPMIVLEDIGGASLDRLGRPIWNLDEFFTLAIQVVETLAQIHARQIMHKDINPSNIVFNPGTGTAKLIDFGLSTLLPRETIARADVRVMEGTLAYISPEQTGRINRAVDYRTDFYSLGVTFYELLTGRLPFEERDLPALVHSHIARQPAPVHEINPAVPVVVSNILMKLLAKNAEDRYQSAYGLLADLRECQRKWMGQQRIEEFPLARYDVSDRLQLSQKLYGRAQEVAELLSAFARVKSGKIQFVLVSGYAGMGKTRLVSEIQVPITQQGGYFVRGRYAPSQGGRPYSALIDALRSLILQLLAESEETLLAWRKKIQVAVGTNGQIVVDMIPEAVLIIGSQPPLPAVSTG